jgi:hypothetical protein
MKAGSIVLLALIVGAAVFLAYVEIQAVPLAWILHSIPILSGVQMQFSVTVSPQRPALLGEEILVTVLDKQSLEPVANATISISLNGSHLMDLYTDEKGQASFEYPGEATIIVVRKDSALYSPEMVIIPKVPDKWVRDTLIATALGIISGIVVSVIAKKQTE